MQLHNILECTKISLYRLLSGKKWRVIVIMLAVFSFYVFSSVRELAQILGGKIPPVAFIWFLSFYLMLVFHGSLAIFLFSDIGDMDGYTRMMLIRCGRTAYIIGQCIYILLAALLYVLVPLMLSLVFTFPVIALQNDWGRLVYTMGNSLGDIAQQLDIHISFAVNTVILDIMTPTVALLYSLLFMWLTTVFIGAVMLFFRVTVSKMSGIIVAGIFVGIALFAMFDGLVTVGSWLNYISPVSWSDISQLDWLGGSKYYPSARYAGTTLVVASICLSAGSIMRFVKGDLKE